MATEYPWAHERKLRLNDEEIDYLEEDRGGAPGKRKFECKRLKGKHTLEWIKGNWQIGKSVNLVLACTACGKQRDWAFVDFE